MLPYDDDDDDDNDGDDDKDDCKGSYFCGGTLLFSSETLLTVPSLFSGGYSDDHHSLE